MRLVWLDAVFDETLDGAEARVRGRFAPRISKRGPVPRVRKDLRAPLARVRASDLGAEPTDSAATRRP